MNPVPHLQRLLMLVLGMMLPKEELERGEREGHLGDATRVAIRRFLLEHRLEVPERVEERSAQWYQWLIERLEAAKKPEFIVFGQIQDSAQQPLARVRVRALDRDLPSLERRNGSAPNSLGEAV